MTVRVQVCMKYWDLGLSMGLEVELACCCSPLSLLEDTDSLASCISIRP